MRLRLRAFALGGSLLFQATRLNLFILWLVVTGCFWAMSVKIVHMVHVVQVVL
jgi:hypothetical protein